MCIPPSVLNTLLHLLVLRLSASSPALSFFFILSPLEILLIAILVLSAFFSNHQPLPAQHTRALMLETADSLPRARFLLQGQTSSNLADMRQATVRFR